LAQYRTPGALVAAVEKVRGWGYRRVDAYAPYPVRGLRQALGLRPTRLRWAVLLAGIAGALAGFFMQVFASVKNYPLNIGARPLFSWPAFVPVSFELGVLCAALAAVAGMLLANGLPRLYHPVFNAEAFRQATEEEFFLSIESRDDQFHLQVTGEFLLKETGADAVHEVKP